MRLIIRFKVKLLSFLNYLSQIVWVGTTHPCISRQSERSKHKMPPESICSYSGFHEFENGTFEVI